MLAIWPGVEPCPVVSFPRRLPAILSAAMLAFACTTASAGGPEFIAGTDYFDHGVVDQPVHWANGQLNYYVDQGPLNSSISHQQALTMVDSAVAIWSAIPTAAVTLTNKDTLNADVSGANTAAAAPPMDQSSTRFTAPARAIPLAARTTTCCSKSTISTRTLRLLTLSSC